MKAVLFSIQPQHCFNITQYLKLNEVRKTKPKIDVPFKAYIYCTKNKNFFTNGCIRFSTDDLYRLPSGEIKYGFSGELMCYGEDEYNEDNFLNGKVIGEFICDYIAELTETEIRTGTGGASEAVECSCLSIDELLAYKGAKDVLYFLNISDLVIYDTPKELSEFQQCHKCKHTCLKTEQNKDLCKYHRLSRAPQSYCFVEEV